MKTVKRFALIRPEGNLVTDPFEDGHRLWRRRKDTPSHKYAIPVRVTLTYSLPAAKGKKGGADATR